MVNFDQADTADGEGASTKMGEVKVTYTPNDVRFWFGLMEIKMKANGINSQYTKLQYLINNRPDSIMAEVKPCLNLQKEQADNTCYKTAKDRIIGDQSSPHKSKQP